MSALSTVKMTSKQYLMLGEDPPGIQLELAYGQIVISPGQTPRHSENVIAFGLLLDSHVKDSGIGKVFLRTDVVFDVENARRPDISYFSEERANQVGDEFLQGPP